MYLDLLLCICIYADKEGGLGKLIDEAGQAHGLKEIPVLFVRSYVRSFCALVVALILMDLHSEMTYYIF